MFEYADKPAWSSRLRGSEGDEFENAGEDESVAWEEVKTCMPLCLWSLRQSPQGQRNIDSPLCACIRPDPYGMVIGEANAPVHGSLASLELDSN